MQYFEIWRCHVICLVNSIGLLIACYRILLANCTSVFMYNLLHISLVSLILIGVEIKSVLTIIHLTHAKCIQLFMAFTYMLKHPLLHLHNFLSLPHLVLIYFVQFCIPIIL